MYLPLSTSRVCELARNFVIASLYSHQTEVWLHAKFSFQICICSQDGIMRYVIQFAVPVHLKAKPHGCCIFSMILHEAPSMETTTPKGEWFPCRVAEWSIMENMQQQMWFCFYPSPMSINISIYVYNALRLTPEIWFWAMPFASFQIDINKYFAIVSPRCQVISNCDVMSPWITWQNNRLMISRFAIFSREYLLQTVMQSVK